jgi:hypothetical protein
MQPVSVNFNNIYYDESTIIGVHICYFRREQHIFLHHNLIKVTNQVHKSMVPPHFNLLKLVNLIFNYAPSSISPKINKYMECGPDQHRTPHLISTLFNII